MSHSAQETQWYDDRKSALQSFRVEADKRTAAGEWLAGEDPAKFVSESLENWLKDNPFPEKEIPMQHKGWAIEYPCLRDFRLSMESGMVELGKRLTAEIGAVIGDCKKDGVPLHGIRIIWVNIPNDDNQDGGDGKFHIVAFRGTKMPEIIHPREDVWERVSTEETK